MRNPGPEIRYLLSDSFDYGRVISPDVGPAIAEEYSWTAIRLRECQPGAFPVVVVDNRFPEAELPRLREIAKNDRTQVVLRVVDPIWFSATREHPWNRFVWDMLERPNVHLMLTYAPAEYTALMVTRRAGGRFIFAPYLYRPEAETPIDHDARRHKILLSGSTWPEGYPLRARFQRQSRWWPHLRLMTDTLPHPGYPDIGEAVRHGVVGDKYIARLRQYRFGFVCPTRSGSELLRYREFAYAGLVPVGSLPDTLIDCPADAWIPYGGDPHRLVWTVLNCRNSATVAENFRRYMHATRDRATVAPQVNGALRDLVARC